MLAEEGFSPGFDGRESRVERFMHEFWCSDEAIQERVKGGLVEAISRWDPRAHSAEVLVDLADIAGYLKFEGALPGLIGIIDNKVPSSQDVELKMLRARVVSSVSAFATHKEAKSALRRWYDDDSFDWTCAEIICNGLIEGDPENAQYLLKRLLTRIDDPDYFYNPGLTASDLVSFIEAGDLERILIGIGTESATKLLSGMQIAREIEGELKLADQ